MDNENINLKNFKYYVVPIQRRHGSPYGKIQDKIFDFWVEQWTNHFKKSNPKSGWQDHFLRMSLATAIGYEDQIIGCTLHTFYNLSAHSTLQSEYFSYLDKKLIEKMYQDGFKDAMTNEYVTVCAQWNKNAINVSFGKVLMALSSYVAEAHDIDGIICTPIEGNTVSKMLENIGAVVFQENIKKYGYTLKAMLAKTKPATKSLDTRIHPIVESLWQNSVDYSLDNLNIKQAA